MKLSDAIRQSGFPNAHTEMVLNILFTGHWVYRLGQDAFRAAGISHEQYNILRILRGNRGAAYSLGDVRERMLNRTANTTRLVEKLRKAGLVERTPCEADRRRVDIVITDAGVALLERLEGPQKAILDRYRAALSDAEDGAFVERELERKLTARSAS